MGALWVQDIRQLFSKRRLLGVGALVLFGLCAFLAVRGQVGQTDVSERVAIGIVNRDTSIYSKMLLSSYEENGLFTSYVSIYIGEEEEIRAGFDEGELDMYLVIPEDFADSMTYLEHLPVQAVISAKNPAVEIMLKNLMQSYEKYIASVEIHCVALYDVMLLSGMPREQAQAVNARISVQLILKALSKGDFFEHYVLESDFSVSLVSFYALEMVLLVLTFLALLAGLRFRREDQAGIFARLNTLGVGSIRILTQKLLFFAGEVCAGLAAFHLLFGAAGYGDSGRFLFLIWLYACLMGAVMLFMAAAFRQVKNYLLAANMFLLLGAVLGGGLVPFMYLPEGMRTLAQGIPNYRFLRLIFDEAAGELSGGRFFLSGAACAAVIFLLLLSGSALHKRREGCGYGNA